VLQVCFFIAIGWVVFLKAWLSLVANRFFNSVFLFLACIGMRNLAIYCYLGGEGSQFFTFMCIYLYMPGFFVIEL